MSVDTTYIINQFARQKTLQVQMTNMPDTVNVSVTNSDVYMEPLSHIDSVTTHIDRLSNQITQAISALSAPGDTTPNTTYELLTRWAIPLLIALIAMAAPLLLHNINGLDTKYHSTRIIDIFKKSITFCIFKYSIVLVAIAIGIKFFTWTSKWSSIAMLCVSCAFLCVIVALCILIMIFYSYPNLILYIQWIYNCNCRMFRDRKSLYYRALTDSLHYAIRQNDKEKSKEILAFFYQEFVIYREKSKATSVVYPQHFYDYILETTEFVCRGNYIHVLNTGENLNHMLPIDCLFSDQKEYTKNVGLCDESYAKIWRVLLMFNTYRHKELYLSYWEHIQKYYYEKYYTMEVSALRSFIAYQEKFGALLMAYGHYDILHDVILWTKPKKKTTIDDIMYYVMPPAESLIEVHSETVLKRYIQLMESLEKDNLYLPNVSATNEIPIPLKEYCIRYMALLYLISCHNDETNKFFYYEEGEDFGVSGKTSPETVRKQVYDLERAAIALLQDTNITNYFSTLIGKLKKVPSPSRFVEVFKKQYKMNVRISEITDSVYDQIDDTINKGCEMALIRPLTSEETHPSSRRLLKSGLHYAMLIDKEKLLGKSLQEERLKINVLTCSRIVNTLYSLLRGLPISNTRDKPCPQAELLSRIDKQIDILRGKKSDYVIITDDSYCADIFRESPLYHNDQYKGIETQFYTQYTAASTHSVWLLKKHILPTFAIEENIHNEDLYGYLLTLVLNGKYPHQRLLLDMGRVPSEVLISLKKDIPEDYLPKDKQYEDLVLLFVRIPINFYTSKTLRNIFMWTITDVPTRVEREDRDDYEDQYSERDSIDRFIITPEQHNSHLK